MKYPKKEGRKVIMPESKTIPRILQILYGVAILFLMFVSACTTYMFQGSKWQEKAREHGWIPQSECSPEPLSVKVIDPGDGATVSFDISKHEINETIAVQFNRRPLNISTFGVVYQDNLTKNYFISYPIGGWNTHDQVTFYIPYLHFRKDFHPGENIELRLAIFKGSFKQSGPFKSLNQIHNNSDFLLFSGPIQLKIIKEDLVN